MPWTNPLKIAIGSDEHILDTTINRGLMMLLNNDYYLDMKQQLESHEIEDVIKNQNLFYKQLKEHINNNSIHGAHGTTFINNINNTYNVVSGDGFGDNEFDANGDYQNHNSNSYNNSKLYADDIVYLPIDSSGVSISKKIASVPHNLNGHTLVFMFVIPLTLLQKNDKNIFNKKYNEEIIKYPLFDPHFDLATSDYDIINNIKIQNDENDDDETNDFYKKIMADGHWVLDLGDDQILFENFYNGTLLIYGDFLHDTFIKDKDNNFIVNCKCSTLKTADAIADPIINDGINISDYINRLYDDLLYPEQISNIINYEDEDPSKILSNNEKLNKIIIKGSGINESSSFFILNNIKAKCYIKNLSFESSLAAENNVVDLYTFKNLSFPTNDKFLLHYPLINNGEPIISEEFKKIIDRNIILPIFDRCDKSISLIKQYYDYIYNQLTIERSYQHDEILNSNDSILDRLNKEESDESDKIYVNIEQYKFVLNAIFGRTTHLRGDDIHSLHNSKLVLDINNHKNYFNERGIFKNKYIKDLNSYISKIKLLQEKIKFLFVNSADFTVFLSENPDILFNDDELLNIINFDTLNLNEQFLIKYLTLPNENEDIIKLLDKEINILTSILKDELQINSINDAKLLLSFYQEGNKVEWNHNTYLTNDVTQSNYYIKSPIGNRIINGLYLTYDLSMNEYGYLKMDSSYVNILLKIIFKQQDWTNGTEFTSSQKFNKNQIEYSNLYNSFKDSTITFWTKFDETSDINDLTILSVLKNGTSIFSINPYSFTTIIEESSSDMSNSNSTISSSEINFGKLLNLESVNKTSWLFWSIKIDNFTRDMSNNDDENIRNNYKNFKNKIGLKIDVYAFYIDKNKKVSIKKYNLNRKEFDENNISDIYYGNTNNEVGYAINYVVLPFQEDDILKSNDKYVITIGYSNNMTVFNTAGNRYEKYYYGVFRNLILFKGHLSESEENGLFFKGILDEFNWPSETGTKYLQKLISSKNFYIGLLGIFDSSDINIINCNLKFNGKTYIN